MKSSVIANMEGIEINLYQATWSIVMATWGIVRATWGIVRAMFDERLLETEVVYHGEDVLASSCDHTHTPWE